MKSLSKIATGILSAIVLAGSMPTTARALYTFNAGQNQYNNEFELIGLNDATAGPAQGFWVLQKGAPKYNLLYGAMGNWTISPVLFNDGSLKLAWTIGAGFNGQGSQGAFHQIDSNGKLIAVSSYSPFMPFTAALVPIAARGPVGKSTVHQVTDEWNGNQSSLWVVGPDCRLANTVFIPNYFGTVAINTDEYSKSFQVVFTANPIVGRAGQATVWEFDEQGKATAARTYAY